MDWHVQLSPNERRQVMQRVAQALKQAQPNYAPQQIAQVARNFGMKCAKSAAIVLIFDRKALTRYRDE